MKRILILLSIAVLLVGGGIWVADFYADKKAEEKIIEFFGEEYVREGKVRFSKVDHNLFTGETVIENVELEEGERKFIVERIVIKEFSDTSGDIYFYGAREEGYKDELFEKLDIHLAYKVEPEKGKLIIEDISVSQENLFLLQLSLILGNYDHRFWERFKDKEDYSETEALRIASEMASLKLERATLRFVDMGFKNKLLEEEARKRRKTIEEVRREIIRELEERKLKAKEEFTKEFYDALIKFIREGKEIVAEVNPEEPLKFQDIFFLFMISKDGSEVIKLLNPKITVR